jgi:hypothetical protein
MRHAYSVAAALLVWWVAAGSAVAAGPTVCIIDLPGNTGIDLDGDGRSDTAGNGVGSEATIGSAGTVAIDTSTTLATDNINRRRDEATTCTAGMTRLSGVCRSTQKTSAAGDFAGGPAYLGASSQAELPTSVSNEGPDLAVVNTETELVGVWADAYTGREDRDPGQQTSWVGTTVGADLAFVSSDSTRWLVGLVGEYTSSETTAQNKATFDAVVERFGTSKLPYDQKTDATVEGTSGGSYLAVQRGNLSLDILGKVDFLDFNQLAVNQLAIPCQFALQNNIPFTIHEVATSSLTNYSLAANVQYQFRIGTFGWVEPTIGLRYSYSDFSNDSGAGGFDDGQVLRVQGGARFGTTFDIVAGKTSLTLTATALLYSDVDIQGFADSVGVGNVDDQGKLRSRGTLEATWNFAPGLSAYVQGDVYGGDDLIGYGGRLGGRVVW